MTTTARLTELALEVGFDLVGVAPLRRPRDAQRFERWLAAGHHADMAWLERQRARITDPGEILSGGKSLLVVGLSHARPPVTLKGGGRVARYAAGRDYHNRMIKLLRKLARRIANEGVIGRSRAVVDAGPLLERSHAAEAGLGFASKAANLLNPRFGPWFFLGELLLETQLEPTPSTIVGSCGTCTACIDACPTDAIREPGVVDANLCISYQTIENRGSVPHALREAVSHWAFGCDICSEVCPWGHDAADASAGFGTHPSVAGMRLVDWLRTRQDEFSTIFNGSPLQRPKRDGLARNAALALGNHPSDEGQAALGAALEDDPSPIVREAAAWGLARAHGSDGTTRAALERALSREVNDQAQSGMRRTLESGAASGSTKPGLD